MVRTLSDAGTSACGEQVYSRNIVSFVGIAIIRAHMTHATCNAVLQKVSGQLTNKVKIVKIDSDKYPKLASKYGIQVSCAVLRCAALRCAVLCCAVLRCAVLCCAVLCCAVLRCAVLQSAGRQLDDSTSHLTYLPASSLVDQFCCVPSAKSECPDAL